MIQVSVSMQEGTLALAPLMSSLMSVLNNVREAEKKMYSGGPPSCCQNNHFKGSLWYQMGQQTAMEKKTDVYYAEKMD